MSTFQTQYTLDQIDTVAKELLAYNSKCRVILLQGELGAGKTTLIKEICTQLGYQGHVSSPTYSLINEYSESDLTIYHMDLYRVKAEEELHEIDFERYLLSDNYCLIEWPQIGSDHYHMPVISVQIAKDDSKGRILTAKYFE